MIKLIKLAMLPVVITGGYGVLWLAAAATMPNLPPHRVVLLAGSALALFTFIGWLGSVALGSVKIEGGKK